MAVVENNKEMVPFEHYVGLFRSLNPEEAAARCGVAFDSARGEFAIRLLYADYAISWPEFAIRSDDPGAFALGNLPAQMLLIRFLLEGQSAPATEKFLTYREMPWGDVYLKPFTGRCLTRAAFTFGTRLPAFCKAMDASDAQKLTFGDASYELEVLPNYQVRLIVWEGDDEFPPNAQILFSANFPVSFSAEDRTVVGDVVISDIKRKM